MATEETYIPFRMGDLVTHPSHHTYGIVFGERKCRLGEKDMVEVYWFDDGFRRVYFNDTYSCLEFAYETTKGE